MQKEQLFADAKRSIFGEAPTCELAVVGYNMAVNYYGSLIADAETAMENPMTAPAHLPLVLRNAFEFSSYGAIQILPEKTLKTLQRCADNFRARYQPLVEALDVRAPWSS